MNIGKAALGILLAVLMLAGGLGAFHFGMDMPMDGSMEANCFMPGITEALCQMNLLEHIDAWQNLFAAIPSTNDILLLLVSLLALGALYVARKNFSPPKVLISRTQQAFLLYCRRRTPMIHMLQEAFSNGILHPKLF